MRWLKYRPLLAATAILAMVATAQADEFTFDYQKNITVSEPAELDLTAVKGRIVITGTPQDKIIIEAVKTVPASSREEAEEVADHIEIKVRTSGSKVRVETNYLKMINRSSSFWSKLLGTGSSNSYGAVDYKISVPSRTSVSIMSTDAQIELSSLEGEMLIENSTGSTRGEYLFGQVTLIQPSGEIDLNWIEGDIRLKSNNSSISIIQVRGAIDLTTAAGVVNIQTELDSPKDCFVETTSGAIKFSVPTAASGQLDISTDSGEIRTELPVTIKSVTRKHLVGEFGDGGPTISLSSITGDVDVNLY